MAISGVIALLSCGGVLALERLGQPAFFLALLAAIVFLLSYVTWLISFLCWIAFLIFPRRDGNGGQPS